MHRQSTIGRLVIFGVVTLLGLALSTGVASATPASSAPQQTSATKDCDGTHHSKTGHGANDAEPHAYNETCDGSPSGNGVGDGAATGKPCAGCVGNADDKNPPGQGPDGSDHNAGYECDRNQGVGKTNPAHTGCTSDSPSGDVGSDGDDGGSTPPPEKPKGNGNGNGHGNGGGGNTPRPPAPPTCAQGCVSTPGSSSPGAEVLSSTEERTPEAALGSAFSAAAGNPAPVEPVIVHAPADVVGLSSATALARPAEVLGVQLRRGDPAPLARTGAGATANLALVGTSLLMVGVALTSVRSRRERGR